MKKIFQKVKDFCEKRKTLIALVITALFVLSQVPFLINHEIWNDEAVPWEISKQITPNNIYELNNAEPHPLLWELILAPFSQNNFPVITLNIISLVIVSLSVFLFLRFSPINPVLKLVFLLSNAFFYFNPVIARDYCLIPLAIALIGITYKKRHEKPLLYGLALAFLSQTHFLIYGLLGILVLGFIVEEIISKNKTGKTIFSILKVILPVGLSVLLLLPVIFGSLNNQAIITGKVFEHTLESPALFPAFQNVVLGIDNHILNVALLIISALCLIGLLAENLKIALYSVVSLGFWLFTMTVVYRGYYLMEQKTAIVTLIFLAIIWLLALEPKTKKDNFVARILNFSEIVKLLKMHIKNPVTIFVIILVFATVPKTLANAFWDLNGTFSSSKENSDFINNLEEDSLIVSISDVYSQFSVATMSQVKNNIIFYNLSLDSYIDYKDELKYNNDLIERHQEPSSYEETKVIRKVSELSKDYDNVYVMAYSYRTPCSNYEPQTPEWLDEYEIVTELDTGEYRDPDHLPVMVFKYK